MGKNHLLIIEISSYKTSFEKVELSPPVQHYASPGDNSRTPVTVYFHDVTGRKPCPDLSKSTGVENRLRH
ncbi:hypothetical protein TNCV_634041 [Trichonephila clavipes]|nr:hypothetical protein TNCV_634041 [Trichonephila clavipes]